MEKIVEKKARGRPLSFDRDQALENAMHVFWRFGYEAASISELTAAMGITPPSLYSAFGDKEHLFWEAIERYAVGPGSGAAIKRLLEEAAEELTRSCHPRGCMMVMAATNCSVASAHIEAALAKRRAGAVTGIRDRIELGIAQGELPADTDAGALANFYATVYQGMSMQSKDGATFESLVAITAAAMRAWPAKAPA